LFSVQTLENNLLKLKINETFNNNQILSYFIEKNLNIRSFNEEFPSLNDIFIELVQGTPESRQFQQV
jgi:ABC-2 type transport system ATP-binding protein